MLGCCCCCWCCCCFCCCCCCCRRCCCCCCCRRCRCCICICGARSNRATAATASRFASCVSVSHSVLCSQFLSLCILDCALSAAHCLLSAACWVGGRFLPACLPAPTDVACRHCCNQNGVYKLQACLALQCGQAGEGEGAKERERVMVRGVLAPLLLLHFPYKALDLAQRFSISCRHTTNLPGPKNKPSPASQSPSPSPPASLSQSQSQSTAQRVTARAQTCTQMCTHILVYRFPAAPPIGRIRHVEFDQADVVEF